VGISIVTQNEAVSGIAVSHAFIVENERYCIEAVGEGVVRNRLSDYFDDPYLRVYFKRPQGMGPQAAALILDAARAKLGQGFSYWGIVGMLLDKTFKLSRVFKFLRRWRNPLNSRSSWFCSELVSFSLRTMPEFRHLGLLDEYHPSQISPQRLFESDLFDPWSISGEDQARKRFGSLMIDGRAPADEKGEPAR